MSLELHVTKKGNKKITYLCDCCGKTKVKKYNGHKAVQSPPKKWVVVHPTYKGNIDPLRYDLCPECIGKCKAFGDLINSFARFYMEES